MQVKTENMIALNPFDFEVKYSGKDEKAVDTAIQTRYDAIPPARFPHRTKVNFDGSEFFAYLTLAKNV